MPSASIVLFATHDVDVLRDALHGIWENTPEPYELLVFSNQCDEEVAGYLTRHYRRGRLAGFGFDVKGMRGAHCGLDRAFHFASGDYLVRAHDDVDFQPNWLEVVLRVLEVQPRIGCLGLLGGPGPRRRGRPRKPRFEPELCEYVDPHCFVTRHALFIEHESELLGDKPADACPFQELLMTRGYALANLVGLARRREERGRMLETPSPMMVFDSEVPFHHAPTGCLSHINQLYSLGDDVLLTCMACGNSELEVLAAKIEFCPQHDIPVGYTYTMRCSSCHELQYEEDLQYRCPS